MYVFVYHNKHTCTRRTREEREAGPGVPVVYAVVGRRQQQQQHENTKPETSPHPCACVHESTATTKKVLL